MTDEDLRAKKIIIDGMVSTMALECCENVKKGMYTPVQLQAFIDLDTHWINTYRSIEAKEEA